MLCLKIPQKVNINWNENAIKIEGPLGTLVKRKGLFNLAMKDSILYLWTQNDLKKEAMYLASIRNLIVGVSKGFSQKLRLVGVGFRAALQESSLILKIGFSHEIRYEIPDDITILVAKSKGTVLIIKGKEKHKVQQVAQEIRTLRIPDAYKGKGIHYKNETLTLKKGKREGK